MESPPDTPNTLQELIAFFTDSERAFAYLVRLRWPDGVTCPHCSGREHVFIRTRHIWRCKGCRKQFGVRKGTVLECSRLSDAQWLVAFWMIANCRNGVSSCELARAIGCCQKAAWHVLHRAREVVNTKSFTRKLSGPCEADEHYHGGKAKNMHAKERRRRMRGRGGVNKIIIIGVIKRGGDVRLKIADDTSKKTMHEFIRSNVRKGSRFYTDTMGGYHGLESDYRHEQVNHSAGEYVRGQVHNNSMESFWAGFRRMVVGTYAAMDYGHLPRYLAEAIYRHNVRKLSDSARFERLVRQIPGKRITFRQLVMENEAAHARTRRRATRPTAGRKRRSRRRIARRVSPRRKGRRHGSGSLRSVQR